jgi:hypothetical protein
VNATPQHITLTLLAIAAATLSRNVIGGNHL